MPPIHDLVKHNTCAKIRRVRILVIWSRNTQICGGTKQKNSSGPSWLRLYSDFPYLAEARIFTVAWRTHISPLLSSFPPAPYLPGSSPSPAFPDILAYFFPIKKIASIILLYDFWSGCFIYNIFSIHLLDFYPNFVFMNPIASTLNWNKTLPSSLTCSYF